MDMENADDLKEILSDFDENEKPTYASREGRRGRPSRATSSREATSQEHTLNMDKNYYDRIFQMSEKGKLYVPPEAIPEGYTSLWVRESVHGNPDHSNVSARMREGWIPPESSQYPSVSSVDMYGEKYQDPGLIRRNGMVLMLRPLEIHALHQKHIQARLKNTDNIRGMAKIGVEGAFATGRGAYKQNITFAEDAKAKHIASMFTQ